jgi:ribosomal protein S18 acetylase RimI-like enzyme
MPEAKGKLTESAVRVFLRESQEALALKNYFGGKVSPLSGQEYIIFPGQGKKPLSGVLAYQLLGWDSRLLGVKAARMLFIATRKNTLKRSSLYDNLIKDLLRRCRSAGVKIIFFRDPVGGRPLIFALKKNKARLISRTLNARLSFKEKISFEPKGMLIREPKKNEFKDICAIMASGYKNRLLRESRLDKNKVKRLYYQWAMNDLSGRVDTCLVACRKGRIAGFIAYDQRDFLGERYGFVDMIVVKKGERKHGIGMSLIKEAHKRLQSENKGIILNFESEHPGLKRFYEKAGFRVRETFNFYHLYP